MDQIRHHDGQYLGSSQLVSNGEISSTLVRKMKRGPKVGKSAFDGWLSNVDDVLQPWKGGSAWFHVLVRVGFSGMCAGKRL